MAKADKPKLKDEPTPLARRDRKKRRQKIAGYRVSLIGARDRIKVGSMFLRKGEHYDRTELNATDKELRENPFIVVEPVDKDGDPVADKRVMEDEALGIEGVEDGVVEDAVIEK